MNHMNSDESNLVLQNGILFGDSGCNVTVAPFEETLRPNDFMIFYVKVADTNSHTHIYYIYIQIFICVHTCGPCALNPWHQLAELIGMAMLRTEGFATGRAGGRTSAGKVTRGWGNSGLQSTEVPRNSPVGGSICYTA